MIQIENLTKKYGHKIAVANLNLKIPPGKLFAFTGPNGAGKTTTVKLMVGLLHPDTGRVLINGLDVHKQDLSAKRILGYIPDQPFTYDKLSGREFLHFIAQMYQINKSDFSRSFDRYVDLFQMSSYIDELIESYSLGMKQRLIISATFLHDPQVIVVDEPLVGLDPTSTRLVKEIFRDQVKQGKTIFMSTHLLSMAEEIADQIGIIHNGQLIAQGTFAELKEMTHAAGQTDSLEEIFLRIVADKDIATR